MCLDSSAYPCRTRACTVWQKMHGWSKMSSGHELLLVLLLKMEVDCWGHRLSSGDRKGHVQLRSAPAVISISRIVSASKKLVKWIATIYNGWLKLVNWIATTHNDWEHCETKSIYMVLIMCNISEKCCTSWLESDANDGALWSRLSNSIHAYSEAPCVVVAIFRCSLLAITRSWQRHEVHKLLMLLGRWVVTYL